MINSDIEIIFWIHITSEEKDWSFRWLLLFFAWVFFWTIPYESGIYPDKNQSSPTWHETTIFFVHHLGWNLISNDTVQLRASSGQRWCYDILRHIHSLTFVRHLSLYCTNPGAFIRTKTLLVPSWTATNAILRDFVLCKILRLVTRGEMSDVFFRSTFAEQCLWHFLRVQADCSSMIHLTWVSLSLSMIFGLSAQV